MKCDGGPITSCKAPEQQTPEQQQRQHDAAAVKGWSKRVFHPGRPASYEPTDRVERQTHWIKPGEDSEFEAENGGSVILNV